MKKLLLVMLVPVMVLGLLSCGKVMDADMMPFELQGSWVTTSGIVLVLSGNQATVYDLAGDLRPAAYRVEVTPTLVPLANGKTLKDKVEAEISVRNRNPGTITFYGFDDKKAATLATVKFEYVKSSNTFALYNLVRDPAANSVLLPEATNIKESVITAIKDAVDANGYDSGTDLPRSATSVATVDSALLYTKLSS